VHVQLHAATEALHEMGALRCVHDPDAVDKSSPIRPILDVVIVDLTAAVDATRSVPGSGCRWKLWELVHFLRNFQSSPRENASRTKFATKTRAIRRLTMLSGSFSGMLGRSLKGDALVPAASDAASTLPPAGVSACPKSFLKMSVADRKDALAAASHQQVSPRPHATSANDEASRDPASLTKEESAHVPSLINPKTEFGTHVSKNTDCATARSTTSPPAATVSAESLVAAHQSESESESEPLLDEFHTGQGLPLGRLNEALEPVAENEG
jgi:hypothetical protein